MPIDPRKVKAFQKDLEDKSKGLDNFLNASKIEGTVDVRILDPLPNMDGLYSLEIPVWWIGKTKIICPEIFGEGDLIQDVISAAEGQNDPDITKLLNAKNEWGSLKVRKQIEYWIPILVLDWKIDEQDQIIGIYTDDNQYDLNLIDTFVRNKAPMVLNCKTQLMKAINHEASTRGGHLMFDREKGFNLILEKTGSGRDTLYKASKADAMPMPAKYYGEGNTPDLMNICKAALYTDEYMDAVIGNYLYGEAIPEKTDDVYRYPEVRASLKKDAPTTEAPKPARPGRPATAAATTAPVDEAPVEQEAEVAAPASTGRPGTPARPGRPATAADAPKRGAGPKRNVADDLNEVDDE